MTEGDFLFITVKSRSAGISCLQRSSLKLTLGPCDATRVTSLCLCLVCLQHAGSKVTTGCLVSTTVQCSRPSGLTETEEEDAPEDSAAASGRDFYFNTQKQQTHSFFSNFPNLMFTQAMRYETKACCQFFFFSFFRLNY